MSIRSKRGTKFLALATGALTGIGVLGLAPTAAQAATNINITGPQSVLSENLGVGDQNVATMTASAQQAGLLGGWKIHVVTGANAVTVEGTLVAANTTADVAADDPVVAPATTQDELPSISISASSTAKGTATFTAFKDTGASGFDANDYQSPSTTVRWLGVDELSVKTSAATGVPNTDSTLTATVTVDVPAGAAALPAAILDSLDSDNVIKVRFQKPATPADDNDAVSTGAGKNTFTATTDAAWLPSSGSVSSTGWIAAATDKFGNSVTTNMVAVGSISSMDLDAVNGPNVSAGDKARAGAPEVKLTATVNNDGTDPKDGVPVTFTVTNNNDGTTNKHAIVVLGTTIEATKSATFTVSTVKTSDNKAVATLSVLNSAAAAGDSYTVAAAVGSSVSSTPASVTITYENAAAASVTLSPVAALAQPGGSTTFTATVKDQFGEKFGTNLLARFTASTRNSEVVTKTVGADGTATYTLVDKAAAGSVADDSVVVDLFNATTLAPLSISSASSSVTYRADVAPGSVTMTNSLSATTASTPQQQIDQSGGAAGDASLTATVRDASGNLLPYTQVTFTSDQTNVIFDDASVAGDDYTTGNTITVRTDNSGVASVTARSHTIGKVVYTATAGAKSETATAYYKNFGAAGDYSAARVLSASAAKTTANSGDYVAITAKVVDRYGNPVKDVPVTMKKASGAGRFANGASTVSGTTDADGMISAEITSGATETGLNTTNVSIPTSGTAAGSAAGTPAGAPAGVSSVDVKVTFGEAKPVFTATAAGLTHAVRITANITSAPAGAKVTIVWNNGGTIQTILNGRSYDAASLIGNPAAYWTINPVSSGYGPWLGVRITLTNGDYYTKWVRAVAK